MKFDNICSIFPSSSHHCKVAHLLAVYALIGITFDYRHLFLLA